jgi:hypothetical protein
MLNAMSVAWTAMAASNHGTTPGPATLMIWPIRGGTVTPPIDQRAAQHRGGSATDAGQR